MNIQVEGKTLKQCLAAETLLCAAGIYWCITAHDWPNLWGIAFMFSLMFSIMHIYNMQGVPRTIVAMHNVVTFLSKAGTSFLVAEEVDMVLGHFLRDSGLTPLVRSFIYLGVGILIFMMVFRAIKPFTKWSQQRRMRLYRSQSDQN